MESANEAMLPTEIFKRILPYCIDLDTFKCDINKEAALENTTLKNVKLQPNGHFSANAIDDIANSSRYKILEKNI